MIPPDPVLLRQIPVIQKIVADETWLEGERRGCYVSPTDRVVRERVCDVVLRIGQQLRESMSAAATVTIAGSAAGNAVASITNTPRH